MVHEFQQKELKALYDRKEGIFYQTLCDASPMFVGFLLKRVREQFQEKNFKILELGFGSSVVSKALMKRFGKRATYYGYDISGENVKRAKRVLNGLGEFHVKEADASEEEFSDVGKVDLILIMELFAHMRRKAIRRVIKRVNPLLNPGGLIIIVDGARDRAHYGSPAEQQAYMSLSLEEGAIMPLLQEDLQPGDLAYLSTVNHVWLREFLKKQNLRIARFDFVNHLMHPYTKRWLLGRKFMYMHLITDLRLRDKNLKDRVEEIKKAWREESDILKAKKLVLKSPKALKSRMYLWLPALKKYFYLEVTRP